MFEWSEEDGRWAARASPVHGARRRTGRIDFDRGSGRRARGRLRPHLNGNEIGGGSLRIHEPGAPGAVFDVLQLTPRSSGKFGFLLDALAMGAPRTAGSRSGSTGC